MTFRKPAITRALRRKKRLTPCRENIIESIGKEGMELNYYEEKGKCFTLMGKGKGRYTAP